MRYIQSIVLLIVVCCTGVSAQSLSGLGIKGGINYSRLSESGTMQGKTDFITQYMLGAYSEIELFNFLFLRYELFYAVRGTSRAIASSARQNNGDQTDWSFTTTRNISLIEPVLLAHFPVHTAGQFRFHVFTGASLGMLVSASSTIDGFYDNEPYYETRNDHSSYLPLDPGLLIGAGIDYRFTTVQITADVRYVHGLMNIWDRGEQYAPTILLQENESNEDGIPRMHSRTISLILGFGI